MDSERKCKTNYTFDKGLISRIMTDLEKLNNKMKNTNLLRNGLRI